MNSTVFHSCKYCRILLLAVAIFSVGCRGTKHLTDGQNLLRSVTIDLKSDKVMINRGEIKDNLYRRSIQKPNYRMLRVFPTKLGLYNMRYKKLKDRPADSLSKWVERPIIFDSALMHRSAMNMKNYLFYQGYFFARVRDTVTFSGKKAYVKYLVDAGANYLINRINYDVDDSNVARVVRAAADGSSLQKGTEFTYSLLDEEKSRITAVVRNNGYYRFSQENVTFKIDTFDKAFFKIAENPFENAINFISQTKSNRKQTIDIDVVIRPADDSSVYTHYTIGSVTVYPDYSSASDLRDSTMKKRSIKGIDFKYHDEYVNAKVLYEHIFLNPGKVYSQADYDKTHVKLNELGIFRYARIQFRENRLDHDKLDCSILLNRTKKYDFSPTVEASSGSTYALGSSVGISFWDRNFMKGANLLTISANGGIELTYDDRGQDNVKDRFHLLTEYYSLKASIDFPKFLAPVASKLFDNSNLPHTIVGLSENVINRVNYFTLNNTTANFTYSWRETSTKSWSFSPGFINIIRVKRTDSFIKVLEGNQYLQNSYKENFIEGENLTFKFDDLIKKRGRNYSYVKLGFEEAGGLLTAFNSVGSALNKLYTLEYAQYNKFDFDLGHYFTLTHSVFAFRFYGGVGLPYGNSAVLPYIKQYFAGGPYSLRGWKIRTLGPGSYFDPATDTNNRINQIDRTGDIKLELNGEYRFPIAPLFAGAVKMNGALFFDAGNIWLAKKDKSYPGGEFALNTLGQSIATDIGAGARFDIASFLTFRLDVAMPVKKPYIHTNGGWVFRDIAPFSSGWRSENLVLNISIGYPF
ncbi:MAG: BamA/TamA family outer membrane protein [Bacteroidota bacterium]